MYLLTRFASIIYVLTVFTGGYLAVSTLSGLWDQADRFQRIAAASAHGEETLSNTLLVFDAIEPATGPAASTQ